MIKNFFEYNNFKTIALVSLNFHIYIFRILFDELFLFLNNKFMLAEVQW